MYRVDDDTKSAYKSDSSVKSVEVRIPEANITLTNDDIISESLELKEAIEEGDNLSFTGCISSSFKIECFNLVDETLEGMWIECDIVADETDTIPLFRGYISEVTNATHEEFTTVIRAYDALYTINNTDVTNWYNSVSFPISMINFRNSFFNYFNLQQVDDYLPNDGMSVEKTIEDAVITGAQIIKPICQVNGRFGRISRTGKFEYVHLVEGTEALYPREDLFPADDLYPSAENALDSVSKAHYMSISFENYRVAPITKVQLVNKDGQIVGTAGTGTNIYTVKDNPLIWGKEANELNSIATNLYNTVQGLWYTPSSITAVGLPYVECGDFVMMSARRSIIRAYVLSRTLKGIQNLTDDFQANGDRTQPTYIPTVQAQINSNSSAITSERSRASSAESGLQRGINDSNNRISRVSADLGDFKTVTAENIQATKVYAKELQAEAISASQVYADRVSANTLSAANAYVDRVTAKMVTTGSLKSAIANVGYIGVQGITSQGNIGCGGNMSCRSLTVSGSGASWITRKVGDEYIRYLGAY